MNESGISIPVLTHKRPLRESREATEACGFRFVSQQHSDRAYVHPVLCGGGAILFYLFPVLLPQS